MPCARWETIRSHCPQTRQEEHGRAVAEQLEGTGLHAGEGEAMLEERLSHVRCAVLAWRSLRRPAAGSCPVPLSQAQAGAAARSGLGSGAPAAGGPPCAWKSCWRTSVKAAIAPRSATPAAIRNSSLSEEV